MPLDSYPINNGWDHSSESFKEHAANDYTNHDDSDCASGDSNTDSDSGK